MQWLFLQLALRRRWARMGNCVDDGRCRTNKRPDAYRAFGVRLTAGSDLLSHTGFPCSGFSYSSRCAADGHAWETVWMTVAAVQTNGPIHIGPFVCITAGSDL